MRHVPRQGPRSRTTRARRSPTSATTTGPARPRAPYGAVPYDPSQDTVPFQADLRAPASPGAPRVPVRARRHERHGHEQRVLEEALHPGRRHVRPPRARPHRGAQAVHAPGHRCGLGSGRRSRRSASARRRPPAPRARRAPPKIEGGSEVGDTVEVTDVGVWARFSEKPRNYNFIWLRDGSPLAKYNGAPIGDENGAVHGLRRADVHAHRRRRRPRDQLLRSPR